MKYIDKLAWLYVKEKRILSTRSFNKDKYYIPGGKREGSESDTEALTREIREELSVELIPASIEYAGTFEAQAHGQVDGLTVRMTCYWADFEGEIKGANEIELVEWLDYDRKDDSSQVDGIIFDWLREQELL